MNMGRSMLKGYMNAAVVGMRYYRAKDKPLLRRSRVITLHREPSNPYDPNAIMVCMPKFTSDTKLGYLGRASAKILAPIMDDGVATRAVSISLSNCFQENLDISAIPCQVLLFSHSEIPAHVPLRPTSDESFAYHYDAYHYDPWANGVTLRDFDERVNILVPIIVRDYEYSPSRSRDF